MKYNRGITIFNGGINWPSNGWTEEHLTVSDLYDRFERMSSENVINMTAEQLSHCRNKTNQKDTWGGYVGGTLLNNTRNADSVVSRDLVCIDLDNLQSATVESIMQRVQDIGCNCCVHSTATHTNTAPRLRAVFPLDRSVSPEEYRLIAQQIADKFDMGQVDESTIQPERLMLWPSHCLDVQPVCRIFDAPLLCADACLGVPTHTFEGGRTDMLVRLTGKLAKLGMPADDIIANIDRVNEERCIPPMTDDELRSTVYPAAYRFSERAGTIDADDVSAIRDRLITMHPESAAQYRTHDTGAGRLFADIFKDAARYSGERKAWFVFDGKRWGDDPSGLQAMQMCRKLADALTLYTVNIRDDQTREHFAKYAAKWQNLRFQKTVLESAQSVYPVKIAEFDADPYLLNVVNGTLDLRTGQMREHSPADLITHLADVEYDSGAKCDRWEQFIEQIMCGDMQLAGYLQRVCGYVISGDSRLEKCWILFGPTTRNGKSTLVSVLLKLLGDYATAAKPASLALHGNNDSRTASGDVATLAGRRFVSMAEPPRNMILDSAELKSWTGNDTITARFLYEGLFTFKPSFKLLINTNFLPSVNDPTIFSSGRVQVIPFNLHLADEQQDMQLKDKLTSPGSLSGILNWLIAGWQMLQAENFKLDAPEAVVDATRAYNADYNDVANYVEDKLVKNEQAECLFRDVYSDYLNWCPSAGTQPERDRMFKKLLRSTGITIERRRPKGSDRNATKVEIVRGYEIKSQN